MPYAKRRLTSLPGLLHAGGYTDVPIYKVLHQHAVNGVIPAHQINHVWHYCEEDLPAIATALGLTRAPSDLGTRRQSVAA